MVVFAVDLQVLGEAADALRQEGDLDLRRTRVPFVDAVCGYDLLTLPPPEHSWSIPPVLQVYIGAHPWDNGVGVY
jgi:hypothetical protein